MRFFFRYSAQGRFRAQRREFIEVSCTYALHLWTRITTAPVSEHSRIKVRRDSTAPFRPLASSLHHAGSAIHPIFILIS
jgi:hypothetical protein